MEIYDFNNYLVCIVRNYMEGFREYSHLDAVGVSDVLDVGEEGAAHLYL